MTERDAYRISVLEVCFTVYTFGWVLDQFATILEHGWYAPSPDISVSLRVC